MFQLPVPSDGAEGVSDEQPLHLDGIKKKDFCLLLNAMFQRLVGLTERNHHDTLNGP
jgi:hypothetical protein